MLLNNSTTMCSKAVGVRKKLLLTQYRSSFQPGPFSLMDAASSMAAYYANGSVFCILTLGPCIVTQTCQLVTIAVYQVFQYRGSSLFCEQIGPHNPWHHEDRHSVYAWTMMFQELFSQRTRAPYYRQSGHLHCPKALEARFSICCWGSPCTRHNLLWH